VSGVTRNLKEAAGKIPARRTEIAYEAVASGREGQYLQSPITIQEGAVGRVYGMKVTRITWGDLPPGTGRNPGAGRPGDWSPQVRQKSAGAIRYFHLVFTLPSELRAIVRSNQIKLYVIQMQVAAENC